MKVLHWCRCGGRCRRVYTRPDGKYSALDGVYHCIECGEVADTRNTPHP